MQGVGVMLLALAACAPRPPIRHVGTAAAADVLALASKDQAASDVAYGKVRTKSLEPLPPDGRATLAFIEFDAHGRPASGGQIETAAKAIRNASANGDCPGKSIVVLFVHGWGHNADARDPHVEGFRATLSGLASDFPNRSVVGIYVSWPARWLKGRPHFLTFWDRSGVANRAGTSRGVRDVLRGLRKIVEEQRLAGNDVVSVAVGHSFGGKFLFSPMEERLEGDTDEPLPDSPDDLLLFGDLVLLVNPAQDVHDFEAFTTYASSVPKSDRPVVVILSSEGDQVMGRLFRMGRTLGIIVTPWNLRHLRSESVGLGWDETQITHTLCLSEAHRQEADGAASPLCGTWSGPPEPVVYDETELRSRGAQQGPFIVVRVDGHLMTTHGDIFNQRFGGFLRSFVRGSVRALSGAPAS